MIQINRNGKNYSENVIDPILYFNHNETFSVTSGTGTASLDSNISYFGDSCLRIEKTSGVTNLVVTNTDQSTTIDNPGKYGFSCYIRKTSSGHATGNINIFKNTALISTQAYSVSTEDVWLRYLSDFEMDLVKGDVITFTFELADTTAVLFDGMMIYNKERNQEAPPVFNYDSSVILQKNITDVKNNTSKIWNAFDSGTIDGVVYEKGDVLLTVKNSNTQKTILLIDFSA